MSGPCNTGASGPNTLPAAGTVHSGHPAGRHPLPSQPGKASGGAPWAFCFLPTLLGRPPAMCPEYCPVPGRGARGRTRGASSVSSSTRPGQVGWETRVLGGGFLSRGQSLDPQFWSWAPQRSLPVLHSTVAPAPYVSLTLGTPGLNLPLPRPTAPAPPSSPRGALRGPLPASTARGRAEGRQSVRHRPQPPTLLCN